MTQPGMVREAGGLNPGGKSRKRLAGRSWEWRDKTLRESRNLIVTEKEESPLTRLQPQAAGDLRVRLLGSWAVKGPVYSECSEEVQPQKVRCSLWPGSAGEAANLCSGFLQGVWGSARQLEEGEKRQVGYSHWGPQPLREAGQTGS